MPLRQRAMWNSYVLWAYCDDTHTGIYRNPPPLFLECAGGAWRQRINLFPSPVVSLVSNQQSNVAFDISTKLQMAINIKKVLYFMCWNYAWLASAISLPFIIFFSFPVWKFYSLPFVKKNENNWILFQSRDM